MRRRRRGVNVQSLELEFRCSLEWAASPPKPPLLSVQYCPRPPAYSSYSQPLHPLVTSSRYEEVTSRIKGHLNPPHCIISIPALQLILVQCPSSLPSVFSCKLIAFPPSFYHQDHLHSSYSFLLLAAMYAL